MVQWAGSAARCAGLDRPPRGGLVESLRNRKEGRNWAQASSSSSVCPHACWALFGLSNRGRCRGRPHTQASRSLPGAFAVLQKLGKEPHMARMCKRVCVCVCATVLPFYSGAPRCLGWFWGPAPHFAPLCSHQQSRPMVSAHSVAVQARCQLCPPGGESTSGLKRQRGLGRHLLWRGEIRPRMKGSPGQLHAAEWLWPTDELGGNVWSNCTGVAVPKVEA